MANTATRERLRFTDEQLAQANDVNLLDLARQYGYELEDKERRAYHAKRSGGLYFYKDNNVFHHFGSDKKGGAVAFVMMEENLSFVEAVKRLLGPSYEPVRSDTPRSYTPPPEKKELVLPDKAANFKRAYWYLIDPRGIDPSIVSVLMNEKKIYQDTRGNCVFVGYDENNLPKYCSKRGTYPDAKEPYKRDQEGSDKSYPFHIAGRSRKVYVLEAPIDTMSHAALSMLHGVDWQRDHRISQGCLSDNALQRFLNMYDINEICFAYDNDIDGEKPVQASQAEYDAAIAAGDASAFRVTEQGRINKLVPYNWGQEAAIANARKYRDMGYKVSIQTPDKKDFNADLVSLRQPNRRVSREIEAAAEPEADMGVER